MQRYDKRHARRSLVHTVAFRAVSQVATMLSLIVLVRHMSEKDYGVLNLLYAFIPVVSTVASLGIEQTLRRYQPEYLRAGKAGAADWLVRVATATRFATNALVLAIVLAFWNLIAPLFQLAPYRVEFAFFGLLVLLHFQARILQLALASHMLQGYSVGSMALIPIAKLAAYLLLIQLDSLTLQTAIFADTTAYGIAYLLLHIAHRKYCRLEKTAERFKPDAAERKRLFRYGLYNNFNDAGVLLLGVRSDNFFIAALMNPAAVGAYSFYNRLSEMLTSIGPNRLFDNVIQPLFFAIRAEEAPRRIPQFFTFLLNINLLILLPALAYSTVYHREIVIVLFGGKFLDSAALLPTVVAFAALNIFSGPATLAAQYAEKASIILLSKITVIYQVAATLTLIPFLGLYGAAIATGTSQLLKNLFIWWHVRHTARWLNGTRALLASLVIWGSVVAICLALKRELPAPPLVHLLIGALLCTVATLAQARSPALAASDRQILGSVLHGREAKLLRILGITPRTAGS